MTDPDFQVSGGAGGTEAHYEDIGLLVGHTGGLAMELATISAECHAALADPDVLASAVLDPAGIARFEKAILSALDGRHGLSAISAELGEQSVALRATVTAYQTVDAARSRAIDQIRWLAGAATPTAFALAVSGATLVLPQLGAGLAGYRMLGDDLDWEQLIIDHPGLVDNVIGAIPGLISALPGAPFVGDVPEAAHLLGLCYPDGAPQVTEGGLESTDEAAMRNPPDGFGDLLVGLDYRNRQSPERAPDQIDVRVITHPDGSIAYVVDIPGTKAWDLPGERSPYLNDLGTNVHVMGGDVTAREQAIAEALRRAGAGPTDPVMLVGHSQGGMVAAQAAHDTATGQFGYHVTHVVTAGSPIGNTEIPANVQVLSLENARDIVPHLDATDNPDRPNRTTVTFDTQNGNIIDNHAIDMSYVPAAVALDQSTDPSVIAYRNSASAFLPGAGNGSAMRVRSYDLTRVF